MIPVRNKRHLWQRLELSIAIFCRQIESAQQKCHAVRNIDLQSVCPGVCNPPRGREKYVRWVQPASYCAVVAAAELISTILSCS